MKKVLKILYGTMFCLILSKSVMNFSTTASAVLKEKNVANNVINNKNMYTFQILTVQLKLLLFQYPFPAGHHQTIPLYYTVASIYFV